MSAKIHADSEPMGDTASARSLLDTCKEETVTLEAVALAAKADAEAATARDAECGATALHYICAHTRVTPALIRAVGASLAPATIRAQTTGQSPAFVIYPEIGWKAPPGAGALHVLACNRAATPACLEALHALDASLVTLKDAIGNSPMCPIAWWGYWGADADAQVAMIRAAARSTRACSRRGTTGSTRRCT